MSQLTYDPVLEQVIDLKPRADCEDCRWTTAPSLQSRGRAMQHVRTRHHRVRLITESIEFWQPELGNREEASEVSADEPGVQPQ